MPEIGGMQNGDRPASVPIEIPVNLDQLQRAENNMKKLLKLRSDRTMTGRVRRYASSPAMPVTSSHVEAVESSRDKSHENGKG